MTETADDTVDNVLGQSVMGDFRPSDLIGTAGSVLSRALRRPAMVARSGLGLAGDLAKLAAGQWEPSAVPGDRRFKDPAWADSRIHSGLVQAHLTVREALTRYAEQAEDDQQVQRVRFLLEQVGDALAPSNFLLTNPVAVRTAYETRGLSLLRGARNFVDDVRHGRPIPSQVDNDAFTVGDNLAATPGLVVLRTEMFELIQYAPQTPKVHRRPIVLVPSIVNKYYVFDLAPGRSVIEYFVQQGITVFTLAWRNPQPRHDRWGMAEYQDSIDAAVDAARAICDVPEVNLWAVCGAGPVAVGYALTAEHKVNSLLLIVSPLDTDAMSNAPSIGAFVDKEDPGPGSLRKRRMSSRDFTLLFAMLRANDLIWNYWVNNYLLGKSPTAFDVLYWNGDGTGMTAQFNYDFSEFVRTNPFATADLSELGFDSYVLGAKTDHLCIWQGVYRSAQLLGSRSRFVLGNSGHIQTIVCPPENPKASFSTYDDLTVDSTTWLEKSERHQGSWWDDGVAWTKERAGELVKAPVAAGNDAYPPLCPAPGTYVHERR